MAHIHGNATHSRLRLRDAHDAHVLFQAVRQGHLQLIRKRLTPPEQQALHSGQVFVWADREGSLERWTDGHNWSPSRVRGPFLMYDEMPEDTEAFIRRKQAQKAGERRVKQPRKKRMPPLPGGLSKQTYSATLIQQGMDIQKWHVTAYFQEDANPEELPTIDDDPLLRTIIVPKNTFKSSMTRKSKSLGRRMSVSNTSERPVFDDRDGNESDNMASPIDEYPPSPPLDATFGGSVSPAGRSSSNHNHYFPDVAQSLPWESTTPTSTQHIPTHRGRSRNESGHNSGSSSGSAGTLHGERGGTHQYFNNTPSSSSSAAGPPMNRGRPMHLEGMHNMFDTHNPHLSFSALSEPRPASMPVLPDWRTSSSHQHQQPQDDRRGSLMSITSTSSRSASSTSTSQSTGASSRIHPSSESSPASSWSQQSPYLNSTIGSTWQPQQQQQRSGSGIKSEHMNSPLAQTPLFPMSAPTSTSAYHDSLSNLPAHLQRHPEVVPSAVPPPFTLPSKKPALPYNLSTETVRYQYPSSTAAQPPPQSYSTSGNNYQSYTPGQWSAPFVASPTSEVKPGQQHVSYPPAIASNLPGSWESAQQQSPSQQPDFPSYPYSQNPGPTYGPHLPPQSYNNNTRYSIPGPSELFDSATSVPATTQGSSSNPNVGGPTYPQPHQQSWP